MRAFQPENPSRPLYRYGQVYYSSAMRRISATTANRRFLQILREVRKGESISVTYRGEPVAVISPIEQGSQAARVALLKRLRRQVAVGVSWQRDELYAP